MNIADIIKQDLRGHDYVRARRLSPQIKRSTTPTWEEVNAEFIEKLPAVLNILAAQSKGEIWDTVRKVWRTA